MKVTFIGTGSGKLSLKRYHSSLLLSFKNYNLLVDTGDSISRALLNAGIEYHSISGILFSHLHPDHFSGLGTLIVQMKMQKRNSPLEIFIHKSLVEVVKNFLINSYLLPERMEFEIQYKIFEDDASFVINNELKVLSRKNSHLKELGKYKQYSMLSLSSNSFLFMIGDIKIIYTGDAGSADDLLLFKDNKIDVLISEITHISFIGLLAKIEQLNPGLVYLTHISDEDLPGLVNSIQLLPSKYKKKVFLAEDRLSFEI